MSRTKVGVIGCGVISARYLDMMTNVYQETLDVVAAADLDMSRAEARAAECKGVKAMSVEALLSDPEIEIVVNLTIPKAHLQVAMKAVEAGKSVYNEKPLTLTRDEGKRLLDAAARRGVQVGCAPDTFLGGGIQTCRKLIDDGAIGVPVAATAFMMSRGAEHWHPDPEFLYEVGGGPMYDMGPYYLTTLVSLLGPVERVAGVTRASFPTRTITSEKKRGKIITVEVPTHVAGLLNFQAGPVGTIITSFDVKPHGLPWIEVYGSEGSIKVPDPNGFGGAPMLRKANDEQWNEVALTHPGDINRGTGVAEMAVALKAGRKARAAGELALHVLDIMESLHDSSDSGRHVKLSTTCAKPAALPAGLAKGVVV